MADSGRFGRTFVAGRAVRPAGATAIRASGPGDAVVARDWNEVSR